MATLHLENLSKHIDGHCIVDNFNLDIKEGEFIVVVGPSGCGKSTLLRLIAGLETVTEGDIKINDRKVNQLEPKDRNIAMVFQNYALYPHMTVYENMSYGLRMRGMKKAAIAKQVEKVAKTLELEELLQRKPNELSGGQRQRVAMGRAMVRKPEIFLFDEPLSNLDAKLRVQMRLEIKKLQRELHTTSLYVTHDQVEAMTLADRMVVINKGKAEQIGTPMEIYSNPASKFVAGFIGSPAMNFIPASISATADALSFSDAVKLPLAMPVAQAQRKIIVGIRPEHLHLKQKPDSLELQLKIDLVEALGADVLLYGFIPGTWNRVCVRLKADQTINPGETLSLWLQPKQLHLFDADTELRL